MSTTNDEQGEYGRSSKCCGADIHYDHCTDCQKYCGNGGHEEEPRAPMLSDEELNEMTVSDGGFAYDCANDVRKHYESLITKGVLRVVKIIPRSECKEHVLNCKDGMHEAMDTYFHEYIDCCPGCGAQIVNG